MRRRQNIRRSIGGTRFARAGALVVLGVILFFYSALAIFYSICWVIIIASDQIKPIAFVDLLEPAMFVLTGVIALCVCGRLQRWGASDSRGTPRCR